MIKEIKCKNCGAQLQPNNEGKLIKCPFCDSYYAYDSDSGALIRVNVSNMGTSNVEASTVIINNYYKSPGENDYDKQISAGEKKQNVSPYSRSVASIICFFLGIIGVHYFYVGKVGTGVLYFFTAG